MTGAIGSSTSSSPAGTSRAGAGLEAQLAKCQVQLADWVACPSGKTTEGKAKIAAISDKISDIEQRMKAADDARQQRQSQTATDTPVATATAPAPTGPIGSRIDIHV